MTAILPVKNYSDSETIGKKISRIRVRTDATHLRKDIIGKEGSLDEWVFDNYYNVSFDHIKNQRFLLRDTEFEPVY